MNETAGMVRQFAYDEWANLAVLETLERMPEVPVRARELLAHLLAAQTVWLARLRGHEPRIAIWPDWSLSECRAHLLRLPSEWRDHLATLDEPALDAVVEYRNSRGERFVNRRRDVLQHVVLHGGYHRGQIAQLVRAAGHEPPVTDFIHAARAGLLGALPDG